MGQCCKITSESHHQRANNQVKVLLHQSSSLSAKRFAGLWARGTPISLEMKMSIGDQSNATDKIFIINFRWSTNTSPAPSWEFENAVSNISCGFFEHTYFHYTSPILPSHWSNISTIPKNSRWKLLCSWFTKLWVKRISREKFWGSQSRATYSERTLRWSSLGSSNPSEI